MGAVFGPCVFLWIVLGSILGGAVHDYMTGMVSSRYNGESIAELAGRIMGPGSKIGMRIFAVVLLILVGTVFVTSPAALLALLTPKVLNTQFWVIVIICYYLLATLIPIDKLIGRLYPVFGVVLIAMAVGILGSFVWNDNYSLRELTLVNTHPKLPVWPFMFITVACGAISGFHATQSPLMSKCMTTEKQGRAIFYGAMICEAVIALVWAAAGTSFYATAGALSHALSSTGPSAVVYDVSKTMLGTVGSILAVIGVVLCPITSGDTAFRSARLIIAEWTGLDQKIIRNRLLLTIPLIAVGGVLTQMNFDIIWRYFSWTNQTLAMVVLWMFTLYLIRKARNKWMSLITAIPAFFMSAVSLTYILMAPEGFKLSAIYSYPAGIALAVVFAVCYFIMILKKQEQEEQKAE